MREGYEPLRISKDLPLDPHYSRAVKAAFNSICDKIQTIATARAKKKEQDDNQEKLKAAKEKLVADAKAKQDAEAAAAIEAATAADATADPAGVLCDLRSVCFFVFWPAFLLHLSYSNPLFFLIYESYQHKQHLPHHHPSLKKNLLPPKMPTLRWPPRFWRLRRRLTTRLRRLRSWSWC